jgi:hypothetical protein
MAKPDSFTPFDSLVASVPLSDPWLHGPGEAPEYSPNYELFRELVSIPVAANAVSSSGALANAVDTWLSYELRRCGFGIDEVWPRPVRPRILPREIAVLLQRLPRPFADNLREQIEKMPAVAPTDAKILGRAYEKQVDVTISRGDRGPELLLSTKTMVSSFGKNLSNRFEEAYGDAGNLRSRYPLAAVGFFFVQRSSILVDEPDAFERTIDMMRKLREQEGANGYTATGLLLVDWDTDGTGVQVETEPVPVDIRPEQFMVMMVEQILRATAVSHHVDVRSKIERRRILVAETDSEDNQPLSDSEP